MDAGRRPSLVAYRACARLAEGPVWEDTELLVKLLYELFSAELATHKGRIATIAISKVMRRHLRRCPPQYPTLLSVIGSELRTLCKEPRPPFLRYNGGRAAVKDLLGRIWVMQDVWSGSGLRRKSDGIRRTVLTIRFARVS